MITPSKFFIVTINLQLYKLVLISIPPNTVKPVFIDHIKQGIFLAFQTGGCLLLHESSAEKALLSFSNNHLSDRIAISMSPEWMVA